MTRAVDEINRLDGFVPVTPQAVAELIAEIKQLRAEIERLKEELRVALHTLGNERQVNAIERRMLELKAMSEPEYPRPNAPPDEWIAWYRWKIDDLDSYRTAMEHLDAQTILGLRAEIERLRALSKETSAAIEKLAFEMPPPNEYTPRFVMIAQTLRAALEPKP